MKKKDYITIPEISYLPFGSFFEFLQKSSRIYKEHYYKRNFNIDESVKILRNVKIGGNVEIGEKTAIQRDCIVGSGENSIVGGVPAKIIKLKREY